MGNFPNYGAWRRNFIGYFPNCRENFRIMEDGALNLLIFSGAGARIFGMIFSESPWRNRKIRGMLFPNSEKNFRKAPKIIAGNCRINAFVSGQAGEDFKLDPFKKNVSLGKMWQLFGEKTADIIEELNEVVAANF